MNNNIQCSIESSTTKIELNSAVEGVFLVPELDGLAGLPEIRTTSGVNAGYDGGWTSAQNYDARLISIRGVIANPDVAQVEAKRRAIASLLGQGRKEQLTLRFTTEAGNAYVISVRTISCEMALQRVLTTQEFLIQLRADDPLIYDDGASSGTEAILQVQKALGGFEIDFELPLAIGGGAEDTIIENGSETVYPIINLYGPLHSPTVVNRTTNQQMQILADLQYTVTWSGYQDENIGSAGQIDVPEDIAGSPMSLSKLSGNATQQTYSGKNLANYLDAVKATNGTTLTFVDNGFRQVTTAEGFGTKLQINGLQSSTTYALSWNLTVNSGTANKVIRVFEGSGTSVTYTTVNAIPSGASSATFTTGENATSVNIWFYNAIPGAGDTTWTYIQLESGSATSYEPYVGGTASPNPDYPQPISTVTGEQTVKVVGKNLVNVVAENEITYSGYANFTLANGVITTTGNTLTGFKTRVLPNTQYTAQVYTTGSGGTKVLRVREYSTEPTDWTTGFIQQTQESATANVKTSKSFTTSATTTWVLVCVYVDASGIEFKDIQLELGNSASSFEPYQGQEFEINLGKNLLPNTMSSQTLNDVIFTVNDDKSITMSGTATARTEPRIYLTNASDSVLKLKAGTTYYNNMPIVLYLYTTTYRIIQPNGSYTPTADETVTQAYIRVENGETVDTTIYPMLTAGAPSSTYAPYFTPIELAKIGTYQDRIYKNDGKWYIEKQVGKVVLDGGESGWNRSQSGTTNRYAYWLLLPNASLPNWNTAEVNPKLCDHFAYQRAEWKAVTEPCMCENTGLVPNMCIFGGFDPSDMADVVVWKTWLSTHNTTVYYALATPTTTEITDETLLAQLNFIASLYGGVNNISIVPTGGAQGEMEVKYATVKTITQDVAVIDSQARTITLNGQDIYHLKSEESEFLLLAPGDNKLYLTSEVSDDSGYAEVKFKQGYLSI